MALPLAARLRPKTFEQYKGQEHLVGANRPLRLAIEKGNLHSMLFWGPPGTGKTTLAQIIAHSTKAHFCALSAVMAGVKDIREKVNEAKCRQVNEQRETILFIDEIHRFNKSQQDALLPFVEDGTVYLIGATTENPSFQVNHALLSRCRVYALKALSADALQQVLTEALADEELGLVKWQEYITPQMQDKLVAASDGDARRLLNIVEIIALRFLAQENPQAFTLEMIEDVLQQDYRHFDNQGDIFYEQISALHKSVRGSSPDGALYWLCRMLDGGCDPAYIARRVVRMASEDIGNADPRGLGLAMDAWQALDRLGHPEGELALAQAVVYLACAPKSNAVYRAFNEMMADIKREPSYDVPTHLRNAPTTLMKKLGYGKAYRYDPDEPQGFAKGQTYFPDELGEKRYYYPTQQGLEIKIAEKLHFLRPQKSES
ncbi:MAG: replication-associated recombination protein A [Candidatus Berkiella sp.]